MQLPPVILQLGAAAAVIYVVAMFLKELKEIRNERVIERESWQNCLLKFQTLMQKMIDKCPGVDEVLK